VLIEEWSQHFAQLVLKAREETSRRHEIEMRASEALKAAIMEASLDSIVTLNRKGEIIDLNPTAEHTLALTRDQAIRSSFRKLFLTADGRRHFLVLLKDSRRARREGWISQARGQLTARRADGSEFPVELSVATGMAHELNQPLSAIVNFANGCSRRLQANLGQHQELVDAMGQITVQAQRASEIIRRLRTLVGKQPPIRSEVDLNRLVREVYSFVEFDAGKMDCMIELDLEPGGIPVDVDLVQIEQVLLNLVRNALDALQEVPPPTRRLTVRTRSVGDAAEVVVEDSGPGIEPERMQSLFEPFFTTKASGMGMGLPISQTILHNHGGSIRLESVPHGGAVFFIRLPVAPRVQPSLAVAG